MRGPPPRAAWVSAEPEDTTAEHAEYAENTAPQSCGEPRAEDAEYTENATQLPCGDPRAENAEHAENTTQLPCGDPRAENAEHAENTTHQPCGDPRAENAGHAENREPRVSGSEPKIPLHHNGALGGEYNGPITRSRTRQRPQIISVMDRTSDLERKLQRERAGRETIGGCGGPGETSSGSADLGLQNDGGGGHSGAAPNGEVAGLRRDFAGTSQDFVGTSWDSTGTSWDSAGP